MKCYGANFVSCIIRDVQTQFLTDRADRNTEKSTLFLYLLRNFLLTTYKTGNIQFGGFLQKKNAAGCDASHSCTDEETEDFNPPFPCCSLPVFPLQLPS